jgi:glyoxylase-like metal-dependent hydrolase (beta-lactamase superfamily II)
MLKQLTVSAAALVLIGWQANAQNAAPDAMALVRAADAAIGASKVKSIHYAGVDGYVTVYGQSGTSSVQHVWPRFNLKSFSRVIDYDSMSMREEQVRTQGAWPADEGGGLRPIVGERRQVHFYRDGFAWNQNPDGSVVAAPQDAAERMLEIVMTPHGFIRAALKARDLKVDVHHGGFNNTRTEYAVTFKYMDKYPVAGWIDDQNHVVKVTTWFKSPMVGDEYVETRYAQYKNYNGFSFGPQVHQSIGVPPDPSYDFEAATVEINVSNAAVQVPDAVRNSGTSTAAVQTRQLAPGTWLVGANNYNSMILEFQNYAAVIEAPLDEARSNVVMAEVRRLIPGKPIRYVVNTHHHFDHAGGLRAYGAEDVLIVTQQSNYDNYEGLALSLKSQMIDPDALARAPQQVHYIRMEEHWTMTDGRRKLEVYRVQNQEHSEDMLMAWLPEEKILVEADLFDRPPAGQTPQPSALNMALLYNMERVRISPERIVSIHSGEIPIADFLRVVRQDKIVPRGQGLDAQLNEMRP